VRFACGRLVKTERYKKEEEKEGKRGKRREGEGRRDRREMRGRGTDKASLVHTS